MKKALVLIVLFALVFGGFAGSVNAAAVCELCDAPPEGGADSCAPLVCKNDPTPDDKKKQGVCQEPGKTQICNPLGSSGLTDIVDKILTILFNFALVLAPLMIVVSGIMFVTAGGSPERLSTAKRILIWTVVGFVIILLARGVIVVLRAIIGF